MISLPSAARHGVSTRVEQPPSTASKNAARAPCDLVLRHDELPERAPDGRVVADTGRDLEGGVDAALGDDAVRVDDAEERRRRVADEVEEVPLAPQLLGVADALADVGAGQHEAEHALAVVHRRQRPGDVDRAAACSAEAMLLLAARVREHALAERCRVLGRRRRSPRRSWPRTLSAASSSSLIPLARAIVSLKRMMRPSRSRTQKNAGAAFTTSRMKSRSRWSSSSRARELRLQAVAVEREPRCDGNRLEQLRLVEQRAVVDDDSDGLAGLARDHRRDALDVVGRHLEGLAVGIDVAVPLLDPGREHDSMVVQRAPQPVLCLLEARGLAHVEQKLRDTASREAAPQEPCQEPERERSASAIRAIVTRTFFTPWSIGPAAKPAARKASAVAPVRPIGLSTRRATGVAARYRTTRSHHDGGDQSRQRRHWSP